MEADDAIITTVEVAVDPHTAFLIFTLEIGHWWRPGPINWDDSDRAIGARIEPGPGGRWLEVYDRKTGEGSVHGRMTTWETGKRIAFLYEDAGHAMDGTEVEIRFEEASNGTRVTLAHRGWEKLPPTIATRSRNIKRWGWANVLHWYSDWAFWGSPLRVRQRENPIA